MRLHVGGVIPLIIAFWSLWELTPESERKRRRQKRNESLSVIWWYLQPWLDLQNVEDATCSSFYCLVMWLQSNNVWCSHIFTMQCFFLEHSFRCRKLKQVI